MRMKYNVELYKEDIDVLLDCLSSLLADEGITDGEINAKGLELETLIDKLNSQICD